MKLIYTLALGLLLAACGQSDKIDNNQATQSDYLDYSGRDDRHDAGVRMIPIETESGTFKVWTKRVGNNPDMKVLLLHGGPGATHEYFEIFDSYFPHAGIEYYYYDQLESAYSDQPNDSTLWTVDRYVNEVEQVRKALELDSTNFYILGSSWGGILGMEYALKHGENLKGLIISNMMASIPDYMEYAEKVLGPQLDPEVLKEIRELESKGEYTDPRYLELVSKHYYPKHVLRRPVEEWPNSVNRAFEKLNYDLYLAMQGPSEFGVVGDAKLKNWDVKDRLSEIKVPTLAIGGAHDTMDPSHMEWIAEEVQNGKYLHCPKGSHLAMWDDPEKYFEGVIEFIREVDRGTAF